MAPRCKIKTSDEDQDRIIEAYQDAEDFITLANSIHVKSTTAYSIVPLYLATLLVQFLRSNSDRGS